MEEVLDHGGRHTDGPRFSSAATEPRVNLSLQRRAALVLVFVIIAVAGMLVELYSTLRDWDERGHLLNAAGRQRLLASEVGSWAELAARGADEDRAHLAEHMALFEQSLLAMRDGGKVDSFQNAAVPEGARADLERLSASWQEVRSYLDIALMAQSPAREEAASRAAAATAPVVRLADALAAAIVRASNDDIRRLALAGLARGALLLGLALATAVFVRRSVVRRMDQLSRAAAGVAAGELHRRVEPGAKDELGSLGLSFNGMAESLERMAKERHAALSDALRFKVMFNASRDALLTLEGPTWSFTRGNAAAVRLFGALDEADLVSRRPWDYAPAAQPDGKGSAEAMHAHIERALRDGSHLFAFTHRRLDGSSFPASVFLSRVTLEGQTFLQATLRDESELRAALAQVEQSSQLAAIGTLAAGVAHEINTPIQFISDSVHFVKEVAEDSGRLMERLLELKRRVADGAPREELEAALVAADEAAAVADLEYANAAFPQAIERCLDGIERVTTIVRSMKEFAHQGQKEMSPADLNRAVETTLTIARNEYKYVADLETELGELPPVICQVNEINQVVLNLVVNAAHAISDVVKDSKLKGKIKVATRREADHVVISVADTGAGISEAVGKRVFEPFFTTKEVGKGSGQGLALAWNVVTKKHRGELRFESKLGAGTTFFVRLPIEGAASAVPQGA